MNQLFLVFTIICSFFSIDCKIIIFGDSHSIFNFTLGEPKLVASQNIEYNFLIEDLNITFISNVNINWLGPITMHRVGRDQLNILDFRKFNVENNDWVITCFGEIDIRSQIEKQIKLGRSLKEITETLASKYIDTVKLNSTFFENLKIIVCTIMPPRDYSTENDNIPEEIKIKSSIENRILYTKLLNQELKELCFKNNFYILDLFKILRDSNDQLNENCTDKIVHTLPACNFHIKQHLIKIIMGNT